MERLRDITQTRQLKLLLITPLCDPFIYRSNLLYLSCSFSCCVSFVSKLFICLVSVMFIYLFITICLYPHLIEIRIDIDGEIERQNFNEAVKFSHVGFIYQLKNF
jgi:hypothetical protein